jgi:hypothetical protein
LGARNQLQVCELSQYGLRRAPMTICCAALLCTVAVAAVAQPVDPLNVTGKLSFHAESVASPMSLAEAAAYAGILQGLGTPQEWGQGAGGYGKRFASALGGFAIHGVLAFGLDSTLHQDPRYFRSLHIGFWRRTAHAFRGTILTRTDNGGETLSTWRLGSDYGAAFLSSKWYPDRLNTVRHGAMQGSLRLGFDFFANLGAEFWPDVKRRIRREKQ